MVSGSFLGWQGGGGVRGVVGDWGLFAGSGTT